MDRFDYVVRREDYKRGNNIERRYKKNFTLLLLDIFDNCCAKCSRRMNGIEIDHFFLPKMMVEILPSVIKTVFG